MKGLAGTSVFLLGVLIFLLLALAVYLFRTMPLILGGVLIAEVLVLAAAIFAPLLASGAKKGWFGRAVFALVAVALANLYMLFLGQRWNVEPQGLYHSVLHWQDSIVRVVGFVIGFLDDTLKAVLNLREGPISSLLHKLRPPNSLDLSASLPGSDLPTLRLGMVINLLIGVIGSLWTASVVKGVLPSSGGGKAAAHH
jgi:hypothetical protein